MCINILITGGSGFIGSELSNFFISKSYNVTIQFYSFWWLELLVVLVGVQWTLREGNQEEESSLRQSDDPSWISGQVPGSGDPDQEVRL